jgi:hypothetical protein
MVAWQPPPRNVSLREHDARQAPNDAAPHQARLTAKDFWLLADSGAFANHARTELIEGEILVVNSVHRWHARAMVSLSD